MLKIAYQLGVKLAISRWREAIRSGEVSPGAAATIKQQVGFDPKDWGQRLRRGAAAKAKSLGYTYSEHTPRSILGDVVKSVRQRSTTPIAERAMGLSMGLMGGGGMANPAMERIDIVPGVGPAKRMGPLVGVHEATEAQFAKRFGDVEEAVFSGKDPRYKLIPERRTKLLKRLSGAAKEIVPSVETALGGTPIGRQSIERNLHKLLTQGMTEEMGGQFPKVYSSMHMDPELVVRDIREGRLLGGKAQKAVETLRGRTGELIELEQAARHIAGQQPGGYLPEKSVREIAKRMRAQNLARIGEIAEAEAGPISKFLGSGIRKYGPALRRLLGK